MVHNCLKCNYLSKIDKRYPHELGIELKCRNMREPRLIQYMNEDELIKMTHNEYPLDAPTWCPLNK